MTFPVALRSLRHQNFRLFLSGQLVSLIGTWMQMVAQAWLVYRLTGSSVQLGLIGFAGQIPVFLLAPLGGAVADRVSRHRVVVAAQATMMVLALLLAVLTLSDLVRLSHIYVLATLLGMANAFDMPARQAFVIEMVGRSDLQNAIALNSSMVNAARIAGPAIAGLTVAAVGEGWCFLINGLSYVAVIAGLLAMRVRSQPYVHATVPAWASILEGLDFVARTEPVRALLLLLGLVSLMGMPYTVLMPVFADQMLGGGVWGYGTLLAAAGVGSLAGAVTLTMRRDLRGLGKWVAIACGSFGVGLVLFSLSRHFWLSASILLPTGYFMMFQMAASNTLIQSMVPDALRGRVMAVYSMMFIGMAPFGALLAGMLADAIGPPLTVAVGGAACLVGAVLFAYRLPALRGPARKLIVAQQAAAGDPAESTTGTATRVTARHERRRT
ncbi:MAG: MFS transporter [Luteitalea sp.]|nr:MFS transporter [Luteitalea sp.]